VRHFISAVVVFETADVESGFGFFGDVVATVAGYMLVAEQDFDEIFHAVTSDDRRKPG
jgi:hypothetical protein